MHTTHTHIDKARFKHKYETKDVLQNGQTNKSKRKKNQMSVK